MNEDFVSFSLAKKLKKKGFNKHVCGYYRETGGLSICNTPMNSNALENEFSAPTISQVLKWLREEKKILVVAAPAFLYREARYFWQCGIYEISLLPNVIPFRKFIDNQESYDSAIIAGIECSLDNFI